MLCVFSTVCWEKSGALARTLRQQEYMGIAMVLSGTEWHEVAWCFFNAFMQYRGVSRAEDFGQKKKGALHVYLTYGKPPYIPILLFDFIN